MINLKDIENYCRHEIHKGNKELDHKTHLRFRGRKEASSEILGMIINESEMNDASMPENPQYPHSIKIEDTAKGIRLSMK